MVKLLVFSDFEGIDEDWIIVVEALPVARNQPDPFISFESECPAAVERHFVEPIANRELVDFHRLHRLNERKVGRGFYHRSIMEQACQQSKNRQVKQGRFDESEHCLSGRTGNKRNHFPFST